MIRKSGEQPVVLPHYFKSLKKRLGFVFVCQTVVQVIYCDYPEIDTSSRFRFLQTFHGPVIVGGKTI